MANGRGRRLREVSAFLARPNSVVLERFVFCRRLWPEVVDFFSTSFLVGVRPADEVPSASKLHAGAAETLERPVDLDDWIRLESAQAAAIEFSNIVTS